MSFVSSVTLQLLLTVVIHRSVSCSSRTYSHVMWIVRSYSLWFLNFSVYQKRFQCTKQYSQEVLMFSFQEKGLSWCI